MKTLHNLFSECLRTGNFPDNLKIVDITPIFKKKDPLNKDLFKKKDPVNKENYRPISVLPSISKIFEKKLQKQITVYINNFLSPYAATGFVGAVLMDLSKVFDTINHDLLIAKLHVYGFDKSRPKLLFSYLNSRWHGTKINQNFSLWEELLQAVSQGSLSLVIFFTIFV